MNIQFGNKIRVGDPCYVPGEVSDDAVAEFPAVAGDWFVTIDTERDSWGSSCQRVKCVELRARGEGHTGVSSKRFELGVDSGQMAFETATVKRGGEYDEPGYYGDACRANDGDEGFGVFKADGVDVLVSSSGYGDGCYPLDVTFNAKGEAVAMKIVFLEDEEEEETCSHCGNKYDDCRCNECSWCGNDVSECTCDSGDDDEEEEEDDDE